MRILFACLLLSTASLAKLVDDPQCELNKGKLCPGGCCYDNQQDWFCCCDNEHCAATDLDCPTKCGPDELPQDIGTFVQNIFSRFYN